IGVPSNTPDLVSIQQIIYSGISNASPFDLTGVQSFTLNVTNFSYNQAFSSNNVEFTLELNGVDVTELMGSTSAPVLTWNPSSFSGVNFSDITDLRLVAVADVPENGYQSNLALTNFSAGVVPEPATWFAGALMFVGIWYARGERRSSA